MGHEDKMTLERAQTIIFTPKNKNFITVLMPTEDIEN